MIFSDLQKFGKAIVEDTGGKNDWWKGVARELGQEIKNLNVDGVKPIMPPISNHEHNIGVVVTNKDIQVKTEEIGQKIRYLFFKN